MHQNHYLQKYYYLKSTIKDSNKDKYFRKHYKLTRKKELNIGKAYI